MGIGIVISCIVITILVMASVVNGTRCEQDFRALLIDENDVTSNKLNQCISVYTRYKGE